MAVDLADLIDPLKREVNPPGSNLYPDAVDDDWLGQLRDSFWEAKLFGFFDNYTETEGLVSPITGTTEIDRQSQQLNVLFAGIRVVRMALINTNTLFRAVAGPVEFETQNSANLLNEILKQLQAKINLIYSVLGELSATTTGYIDSLVERDFSLAYSDTWWASSDSGGLGTRY
jgi:hypothetical protein